MFPNSFRNYCFNHRSNCIPEIQRILRKHYNRPNFLPEDSEMSSLDWILMGGGGYGAQMHVSKYVSFPKYCI